MTDQEFLQIIEDNRCAASMVSKTPELLKYIRGRFVDARESDTVSELIWRLKKGLETRPVCRVCGKPVAFLGSEYCDKTGKTINGYRKTCSYACKYRDPEVSQKFSNTYNAKTDEEKLRMKRKREETTMQRFGVANIFQLRREQIKQTMFERYGGYTLSSPELRKKIAATNLERYGAENPFANENVKQKIKETCLQRYGAEHYYQSEEGREVASSIGQQEKTKERRRKTCREKYGTDYPQQNNQQKAKWLATMKQLNVFHSMQEDRMYDLLANTFDKVERQYTSGDYPYMCDFYIPDLQLYIEYNGCQQHMLKPYDPTSPLDIAKAEELKSKNFDWQTWAEKDV